MSTDPREFEHPIDGPTPNQLPNVLGVGSLTPEAIEAAARALYVEQNWCTVNAELDEDPVPKSEYKRMAGLHWDKGGLGYENTKKYMRLGESAAIAAAPFIAAQAKAEALAPILALHRPEKRWTTPDYTGSFDTREEAAELDESYDGPNVYYFEICAECGRIERDWDEDHAEEWTYKLAMWPCKTAAAVLP